MSTPRSSGVAEGAAEWTAIPERSNLFALRLMMTVAMALGRSVARWLLVPIALYFVVFAHESRRQSRAYLERVLDRPVRWLDTYRHFHVFAATILDRIWLLREQWSMFDIRVEGAECVREGGQLLYGAHMGSFEAVRAVGREHSGLRVTVAMFEANARKVQALFRAVAPKAQQDIVALGCLGAMLCLRGRLDEGGYVGILADRTPGPEPTQQVTILGAAAQLPIGPFRLACALKRPVVFMIGVYRGGNRYDVYFERLADFSDVEHADRADAIKQAIDAYAARLDFWCRAAPFNWFNFFSFWDADGANVEK